MRFLKFHFVSAAAFIAMLAACMPEAETDGAAAPTAPPAADIAAPAPNAGPAAPNTTDTLSTTPPAQATGPAATPDEITNGRGVYARTCAMCHGPTGQGTQIGVAITMKNPAAIAEIVAKGSEKMLAMASMLSADDVDDVSKFVAAGLPQ